MILTILTPLVGVLGALLLSFGAWMILLCLTWSWMVAKFISSTSEKQTGGD